MYRGSFHERGVQGRGCELTRRRVAGAVEGGMRKPWVACVGMVVVTGCTLLAIAGTARPASAATLTVPLHQYNMCDNVCSANRANTIAYAEYLFAADSTWTLSANELCHSDFLSMLNALH